MIDLSQFPHYPLGHFPTPLQPMLNLTTHLRDKYDTVPKLWIKRDDCTGLASGGNKTRKLEFIVGDALRRRADVLITSGGTQSNHARQTAAAAARAGLGCKLVLENRLDGDDEYQNSGNVLLDRLLGADIVRRVPAGTDVQSTVQEVADELTAGGARPYIVPGGGSTPTGSLGYVACAQELAAAPFTVDWIVHASCSAGTQAGLVAGLHALNSPTNVLGVSVRDAADRQSGLVHRLASETAAQIGDGDPVSPERVRIDDRWIGAGYGVPTVETLDAIRLLASTEGILLDPVYTGKGFAGLLGNIAERRFRVEDNVVFVHTGGLASLFAYRTTLCPEPSVPLRGDVHRA